MLKVNGIVAAVLHDFIRYSFFPFVSLSTVSIVETDLLLI